MRKQTSNHQIPCSDDMKNVFNNQQLLWVVIISFYFCDIQVQFRSEIVRKKEMPVSLKV